MLTFKRKCWTVWQRSERKRGERGKREKRRRKEDSKMNLFLSQQTKRKNGIKGLLYEF